MDTIIQIIGGFFLLLGFGLTTYLAGLYVLQTWVEARYEKRKQAPTDVVDRQFQSIIRD